MTILYGCKNSTDAHKPYAALHSKNVRVSWSLTSLFSTNMAISETEKKRKK